MTWARLQKFGLGGLKVLKVLGNVYIWGDGVPGGDKRLGYQCHTFFSVGAVVGGFCLQQSAYMDGCRSIPLVRVALGPCLGSPSVLSFKVGSLVVDCTFGN